MLKLSIPHKKLNVQRNAERKGNSTVLKWRGELELYGEGESFSSDFWNSGGVKIKWHYGTAKIICYYLFTLHNITSVSFVCVCVFVCLCVCVCVCVCVCARVFISCYLSFCVHIIAKKSFNSFPFWNVLFVKVESKQGNNN